MHADLERGEYAGRGWVPRLAQLVVPGLVVAVGHDGDEPSAPVDGDHSQYDVTLVHNSRSLSLQLHWASCNCPDFIVISTSANTQAAGADGNCFFVFKRTFNVHFNLWNHTKIHIYINLSTHS